MAKASPATDKCINRRTVLKGGAALAAAVPALLRGGHAEAQPRANRTTAIFAYVGAFTTPERKGHGGGINVYRVDPTSGAWSHEQLLEIANPSFLTLDRAQRFLYSVHADLEEVSAYAIDKQNGRITALNLTTLCLIRAAGSSLCPTRGLTGSSSFASTRRAGNSLSFPLAASRRK